MAILDSNVPATSLQYSVTSSTNGLIAGNAYSFVVVSTNVVGDSTDSTALANIIAASVPTVP